MATQYTLNNFVRQASNGLLARYFQTRGFGLGIDVKDVKPRKSQLVLDAIGRMPDDARDDLDRDFMAISALATKAGLQQIVEEARYCEVAIESGLDEQNSILNKVFWTYLHHQQVFDGAAQFALPHGQGRYWKRHLPVASAPGIHLADRVSALEATLSEYFRSEEGRGKACKVEYQIRRPVHFFHAYPEDFPDAPLAWSRAGLEPHPLRPAFEVVFVYNEVEGTLDVYFEGSRRTVERLWQLFAATALGIEQLPKPRKPAFGLEPLKATTASFVRPEDSPIVDVRIKGLRFRILNAASTIVSVETDVSDNPRAIHAAVRRTLAPGPSADGRFTLSQARVIGVTMQATIDAGDGKRPRRRTFQLTETSCSLKYDGPDLLLRQLLVDSGIDQTGRQTGAAASRQISERRAG